MIEITALWRGVDYKTYIMYVEDGKMIPSKQKMFGNRKMLFFVGDFSSAASYANKYSKPIVLQFNDLDYKFYEIKQLEDVRGYYYTRKTIDIDVITAVWKLDDKKSININDWHIIKKVE